eukprot:7475265-Pyramimonas_sp.AAC.1
MSHLRNTCSFEQQHELSWYFIVTSLHKNTISTNRVMPRGGKRKNNGGAREGAGTLLGQSVASTV